MKKIDNYLLNLVAKHNEERQRKIRREKESLTQISDVKMDEEIGIKRSRPEKSQYDLTDFGISLEDFDISKEDQDGEFGEKDISQKDYVQ